MLTPHESPGMARCCPLSSHTQSCSEGQFCTTVVFKAKQLNIEKVKKTHYATFKMIISINLTVSRNSHWYYEIVKISKNWWSCNIHICYPYCMDGCQIFLTVFCTWDSWQLWLPHADAAEPAQRGCCLSWGCAQLLPCPLLWGRSTPAALSHSDPRIKPSKCNPFIFVLGWSSLASQISDLGDGGKTIKRQN